MHKILFVFDTGEPGTPGETVEFTARDWDVYTIGIRDYCEKFGLAEVAGRCDTIFLDGIGVDYI